MPHHRDGRSSSLGAGLLRWAEWLLVIAGVAMLVWCVLIVTDARMAQRVARRSLETASHSDASSSPREPIGTTGVPLPAPTVRRGSAVADLSIPRIHLSAVVLHGSDAQTLRRGPGHLENTALPGDSGNVVIAGHRDSFFRPLRNVRRGDDIFMDTPQGRFHYRVTSLRVVNPHDLSVLEPTGNAILTLITCYPFWVLGHAPDRFVVRATRVGDPAAAAVATGTPLLRESIRAPAIQRPDANESTVLTTRTVHDDDSLVRQAIERFRLTYNARLISHNDARPGGALRFRTCDISIAGGEAAATCEASSQSPDDREPHAWTMTLERADDRWAIRSIVMR